MNNIHAGRSGNAPIGRAVKYMTAALVGVTAAGCAPTLTLSPSATALRDQMTMQKASAVITKHVRPDSTCAINYIAVTVPTMVDADRPMSVTGTVVDFSFKYGVATKNQVVGSIAGGTGKLQTSFAVEHARMAIDMKSANRAVVYTRKVKDYFPIGCAEMPPGFLVAIHGATTTLPHADLTLHVATAEELDALLAALSYLAPGISLVK